MRLKDVGSPGLGQRGRWLAQRALQDSMLVEHEDVGREWIRLAREHRLKLRFVVALAGQPMSGLEDVDLKSVAHFPKSNAGREVEPGDEDRDLETVGYNNVLALAGIEQDCFSRTQRVGDGRGSRGVRQDRGNDASRQASEQSGFCFRQGRARIHANLPSCRPNAMGCVLHDGCKDTAGGSVIAASVKGGARQFTSSLFVGVKPPTLFAAGPSYGGKVFPLGRECAELSAK